METKCFYLVRHGETTGNYSHIHQSLSAQLTEHGKLQAQTAADILSSFSIDTIIASDALRTQETAAPIAAVTNTSIQTNSILRELRRARVVEGTHNIGFRSAISSLLMYVHANNRTWHYEDGESLVEFRDRTKSILELLANTDGKNIVVVSHRGVINALRFGVRNSFSGSIRRFTLAAVFGHLENGSITKLTYDPSSKTLWHIDHLNSAQSTILKS